MGRGEGSLGERGGGIIVIILNLLGFGGLIFDFIIAEWRYLDVYNIFYDIFSYFYVWDFYDVES